MADRSFLDANDTAKNAAQTASQSIAFCKSPFREFAFEKAPT
jgi:hypothetical protein